VKIGDELPDYDFAKGVRGKYAGRYREKPSICHTITTCFCLMYVLLFVSGWLSMLCKPEIWATPRFWLAPVGFGLVLAAAGIFLIRELIRQYRLLREWKSP